MQSRMGSPSRAETRSSQCQKHGRSLVFFCYTDGQVICDVCASREHSGHTTGSVREERKRKQEELKSTQMKSEWILQKQHKKCSSLEATLKQIQEETSSTEDHCESVLVNVIDSLQRHFLSVRTLIGAQREEAAAQVQLSLQPLQVKMDELRKRSGELERLARTDDDVQFLRKWASLQRLCKNDHLHLLAAVPQDHLLPFQLMKKAFDDLGRQLEEFCDQKFAEVSQTASVGDSEELGEETGQADVQQRCEASTSQAHVICPSGPNSCLTGQPLTRAQFLQYACGLSLDPITAHEDLVISGGGKEVKLSPQTCKLPAARYPERFIHRRQVLCRQGLRAERCYYEIEVEGDKAEIALAYKGIDRKSLTSLSAFGGNAKSWSLDRSSSYSVSHRGNSVQLTAPPRHHAIGVYLEFNKGALSFYEVSDSMKFLYKVEAELTEPLYAGFWLGDKCRIRIRDLRSTPHQRPEEPIDRSVKLNR